MKIDDKIRDEKLQYDRRKILLELHTGEEILPSDQSSIIEQVKFTYPLLGKALEKQIKTIEYQRRKLGEIKKT